MPRIAIIIEKDLGTKRGGIEQSVFYTVEQLLELDKGNEYLFIKDLSNKSFPNHNAIRVKMPETPFQKSVLLGFQIPKIVGNYKLDIVHDFAQIGPFWRKSRAKYIQTINDLFPITHPELTTSKISTLVYKYYLPILLENISAIVSSSMSTKKLLEQYYPKVKNKIFVIPHGVSKNHGRIEKRCWPSKIDKKKKYFLFIGSINPRKNIKTIIKAFDSFCESTEDKSFLYLAGAKGWNYAEVFDSIERSKFNSRIKYLGHISEEEKKTLLKNALALLYPSIAEGFGLPILEAFALKTPIITTRVLSLPEIGGKAALYLEDPFDYKTLASIMKKVTIDKKLTKKLAELGTEQVKKFSWEKTAKSLISLYNFLTDENTSNS